MSEIDDSCDMSTLTLLIVVVSSSMTRLMRRFCKKLSVQAMIHVEVFLFLRLCNKRSFETWSYALITFMLSSVIILSLLMFQILWICFVRSSNVVSQLRSFRSLIWLTESRLCAFAKPLMCCAMIDFNALSRVFKSAIDLYALMFV
jgi:hypothetical protein